MDTLKIIIAETDRHFQEGKKLFLEYASGLGFSLCFQNFDAELANITTIYAKPKGILLLLEDENEHYLGCVGVKKIDNEIGELKRLYLKDTVKGLGFGKALLNESLKQAKSLGYKKIVLDTLPSMKIAIALYEKEGFTQTLPYYHNPMEGVIYFEKLV